ncbi:MAG: hypothetical protein Q9191_002779 [Dirinaria sp. TL-2023a]
MPVLETVRAHVLEFEQLIVFRLQRSDLMDGRGFPKVNRTYWLRAGSEIQRIKQNIRDSREMLRGWLELLGLEEMQAKCLYSECWLVLIKDNDSENIKAKVLQIQSITLTSQESIRELEARQSDLQQGIRQLGEGAQQDLKQMQVYQKQREAHMDACLTQMHDEKRRDLAALEAILITSTQPLLAQMKQITLAGNQTTEMRQTLVGNADSDFRSPHAFRNTSAVRISATTMSQQCPSGCRCQCHGRMSVRTPPWLRSVFGQLFWAYNSSISMRCCNYSPCRKSFGKHQFTYYFPTWLVSRAVMASANLDNLFGAGARISVHVPLIIPEDDHIIWSLVIAGNLKQLQHLLSHDRNLVHVRNQWGQSIMHVAAKIHQPAVFNFLVDIGIDEHLPDENQKTAATTVLTRRGNDHYALKIDGEELADRLNWTLLHKAAALTRRGRRLDEALLESECIDINSKDALGRTPLHWLAENGEVDAIRLLTRDPWRADVQIHDICGFTALHCACWADSLESAAVLLDAGSNVNARDKHQRTPLLHFDDHELLDLMIKKGADVCISDDEGANIMHHVAVADQAALAKTLLERYDHKLFVPNRNGDMPLGLAIQNNSLRFMAVLVPFLAQFPIEKLCTFNHSERNILHLAALHGSMEMLNLLAAADLPGLETEARDKDGHSPNECFLQCRGAHCAAACQSLDLERKAWARLMESARRHAEVSRYGRDAKDVCNERKDSFSNNSSVSDEEEFVDAHDGIN